MKHNGSVSQIYVERDRKILPDLIRRAKHLATYPVNMNTLYRIAADLPTDKFYISDDAAYSYMRKRIFRGIEPKFTSPYKQKLFESLYEEVMKMLDTEKYRQLGWKTTTMLALAHPAPCVGLTPYMIGETILRRQRNKHKKDE